MARICEGCGCTDNNACYDPDTDETCGWADIQPPVADFCTFCVEGREGVERPDPPEGWDAGAGGEDEILDLGPCCACGESGESVRNIVMLEKKAPVLGTGWMCLVCGLPPDGAVAVVCDQCLALQEHGRRPILRAVSGYPAEGGRMPVEDLAGEHAHDLSRHPELEQTGSPA